MSKVSIRDYVSKQNSEKILFTPGPASLIPGNLEGIAPCFGRGDHNYLATEEKVLNQLCALSGHNYIARMQGSASLALEIVSLNFLEGNVLIIDTGYYSDRLKLMANASKNIRKKILSVDSVNWTELDTVDKKYDWVFACYTETSCGLKLDIVSLKSFSERISAQLAIDATASIGLESHHEFADVIAYSSCKGLFGLTGASFVAFQATPDYYQDSFYLNLENHLDKKMTGPYHSICSLYNVLNDYEYYRQAVINNKAKALSLFDKYLGYPSHLQPLLCTYLNEKFISNDSRVVTYTPRSSLPGSVICHLGEVHLGCDATGDILNLLQHE